MTRSQKEKVDLALLRDWVDNTQTTLEMLVAAHENVGRLDWRQGVESAIDALTSGVIRLEENIEKTNKAALLEHQGWTRINDLVGLQAEQIRTLGRQLAQLDRTLSAHLEDAGYSE